ncbi:periplasmic trehalase [Cypionkella aquatica]|uniref:Periplasmic trehalase n=1 Tax=Cypionkella aquatica TaxID=1756042 RepID=A0AA37TSQ4_9RHOB|nr:trehalase family glycosidase [Cypionkella aquatica]GLS87089.1 periplasmic trehalase [Cypionkella aquatica]
MEHLEQSLGDLFVDLHMSGFWPDEKAISDSILLAPAPDILRAYHAAKAAGPVDLHAFYAAHFRPVAAQETAYRTDPTHSPKQHLAAIWPHLIRPADDAEERSTRFALPRPYVVVGGRFQEAYYWDSYFTQLGLLKVGKTALVLDMLENFAFAIERIGHIPNGFRSYFLTRSQPPFFAAMVQDYGRAVGDPAGAYARFLPAMQREYQYFIASEHNHQGLARYWDQASGPRVEMYRTDLEAVHKGVPDGYFRNLRAACESGWDFSARWLTDSADLTTIRTTALWAIDLNCLLLRYEEILAEASHEARYAEAAKLRRDLISKRFYSAETGYFHDVQIADGKISPITTAAGMFALYAGAASQAQAETTAAWMQSHLLAPGGLLTTDVTSGQQWDSPNGWAPLQWIAVQGLLRYGFGDLAETLRQRWLATCDAVFGASGKFVEKYNVLDPLAPSSGGEYALQDGFGWSNGVYLDLAD